MKHSRRLFCILLSLLLILSMVTAAAFASEIEPSGEEPSTNSSEESSSSTEEESSSSEEESSSSEEESSSTEEEILVTAITLSSTYLLVQVGGSSGLTATVTPENVTDSSVTWATGDATIATVSETGQVTGVANGMTTVTATANDGSGISASCTVIVGVSFVYVYGTSLSEQITSITIEKGLTKSLNTIPTGATFSSSDESVCTVSEAGLVTAKAPGQAVITVTAATGSTQIPVTVTGAPDEIAVESVTISRSDGQEIPAEGLSFEMGSTEDTVTLVATVSPTDATNQTITWTTTNQAVCTVSNGQLTPLLAGSCEIIAAASNGKYASVAVTVLDTTTVKVEGVELDNETLGLLVGGSAQLTANISPTDATNQVVSWTSSDKTVATVDDKGIVTAVTVGVAEITVTTADGGYTDVCTVTVVEPEAYCSVISVGTVSCYPGLSVKIPVSVTNNQGFTEFAMSLTYDSVLTLNSVSDGLCTGVTLKNNTVSWSGSLVSDASGVLFYLNFTVSSTQTTAMTASVTADVTTWKKNSANMGYMTNAGSVSVLAKSENAAAYVAGGYVSAQAGASVEVPIQVILNGGAGFRDATITLSESLSTAVDSSVLDSVTSGTSSLTDIESLIENSDITTVDTGTVYATLTSVRVSSNVASSEINGNVVTLSMGEDTTVGSKLVYATYQLTEAAPSGMAILVNFEASLTAGEGKGKFDVEATVTPGAIDIEDAATLVTSITMSATTAEVAVGSTVKLTATAAPADATDRTVTWSSSNTGVATVDSTGKVTGISAGTATITATAKDGSGVTGTCEVTVTALELKSITINTKSPSVEVGYSTTLSVSVNPAGVDTSGMVFTSSNTSVATVDGSGRITGRKAGVATITVSLGGKSSSVSVLVRYSGRTSTDIQYTRATKAASETTASEEKTTETEKSTEKTTKTEASDKTTDTEEETAESSTEKSVKKTTEAADDSGNIDGRDNSGRRWIWIPIAVLGAAAAGTVGVIIYRRKQE